MRSNDASVIRINGESFELRGATPDLGSLTNRLGGIYSETLNATGNSVIGASSAIDTGARLEIDGRVSQVGLGNSTFFGYQAGAANNVTLSNEDVAVGYQALAAQVDSGGCVAVGYLALQNFNLASGANTAVGHKSLQTTTTGWGNSALGQNSLNGTTTGDNNVAMGGAALFSNSGGNRNTGVGTSAMQQKTTGDNNVAIGYQAGYGTASMAVSDLTLIGYRAGFSIDTGATNLVGIGYEALYSLTTGDSNTAIGYQAMKSGTTASYNVAIGEGALQDLVSDWSNVAVGYSALNNCTGGSNTSVGTSASWYQTTGTANVSMGYQVLYRNLTGASNVVLGYQAGYGTLNMAVSNNILIGRAAGFAIDTGADNNILIGYQAANNLTTGAKNIVIGHDIDVPTATTSNQLNIGNIIYGTDIDGTGTTVSTGGISIGAATRTDTGAKLEVSGSIAFGSGTGTNLIIGNGAMTLNVANGDNNLIYGKNVLTQSNSFVSNNTIISNYSLSQTGATTTINNNALVGTHALYGASTATENTTLGNSIGGFTTGTTFQNNVLLGLGVAGGVTGTLSNCVFVGYRAGNNMTSGTKCIVIGHDIDAPSATANNQLNIGNIIYGTNIDGTGTTDSTGNIGIGVSSPAEKLDVGGNVKVGGTLLLNVYTDATRPAAGTAGRIIFNSTDGNLNIDDGTNWKLPDGTVT